MAKARKSSAKSSRIRANSAKTRKISEPSFIKVKKPKFKEPEGENEAREQFRLMRKENQESR